MGEKQLEQIKKLKQIELHHSKEWLSYWWNYSSYNNWHTWVVLLLLVAPLILLLIFMDKKKSLLLGFYGYNVHVFFTYIDALGANNGYWFYPYKVIPVLPSSLSLDVSFVPVCYMFVYQWTLKHGQNYYIYMIGLSITFSLVIKPILEALRLFQLERGANFFHLLIGYLVVGFLAKQVTNFFIYLQDKTQIITEGQNDK